MSMPTCSNGEPGLGSTAVDFVFGAAHAMEIPFWGADEISSVIHGLRTTVWEEALQATYGLHSKLCRYRRPNGSDYMSGGMVQ